MESYDREPELIVTFEDEHYSVTLLDTQRLEVVCCLTGIFFDILESETALVVVNINIYHSCLIRTLFSHCVNDIICKVELILIFKINSTNNSLIISFTLDELLRNRM